MVSRFTILLLSILGIFFGSLPTDKARENDSILIENTAKHEIQIETETAISKISEPTPPPTQTPTPTPNPIINIAKSNSKTATTPKVIQSPTPTPIPVIPSKKCAIFDRAILEPKVRAAFPEDPEAAVLIVGWESSWNNCVISKIDKNGERNYGLFQINGVNCGSDSDCERYLDPDLNIAKARQLYLNRKNWTAWGVCYKLNPCR